LRPRDSEENQYREAIRILHDGGLVIAPTETFYGILADAVSLEAVTRLLKLKKRGDDKPIPLIAGHIRTVLSSATEIPDILESITKKFWPGPLTLVLKAVKGFPRGITADTGSIGIRIPAQSVALDLAKLYPRPLTATSANFEGLPAPKSVDELECELAGGVDLIIDGGQTPGIEPSTVLNLIPDPPVMIRSGILGEEVEEFLKTKLVISE
jgi:L-threonylcarbamoyladenylate synthase